MRPRALTGLALCLALASSGCSVFGDGPYVTSTAGLYSNPPQPFVAGRTYDLRVSGDAAEDATFESATVLVFRGSGSRSTEGLRGDTLAAVAVGVSPGSTSFDTTVPVTVPAASIQTATEGWIYVEYVEVRPSFCDAGCSNATGSSVELVPSPSRFAERPPRGHTPTEAPADRRCTPRSGPPPAVDALSRDSST